MNRPKTHQRLGRVMPVVFTGIAICASAASLILAANLPLACGATYTTFQVPGAVNTYATAVSGNNVVGYSYDSAHVFRGYLYDGSIFASLFVPGATSTMPYDIENNKIVGRYSTDGATTRGFIYDGSSYTSLDVPGASSTIPVALSSNNVVGSCRFAGGYDEYGFLYDGSTYRVLGFPGASNTEIVGVSGNTVVGNYVGGDCKRAFTYNGLSYTPLNYPGAACTIAKGISGSNIVGMYQSFPALSAPWHGFLYDGSTYTTIDPPWWDPEYYGTMITAIDGNRIGGSADSTGGRRLFVYDDATYTETPSPQFYGTIEDISGDTIVGTQSIGNTRYGFVYIIPEPSTTVLLGIAAIGLLAFAHRRCQPGK